MKIIPNAEALKLLADTDEAADVSGFGMIPVVRIAEPFKLVIVDGGSGGPDGEPGDYIGLHPNGYPMVIARAVAERTL